jgi:hypothetical protein
MKLGSINRAPIAPARTELGRARLSAAERAANEYTVRALADGANRRTSISVDHLVKFQQYAAESDCVIGLRAVDPLATSLIGQGHPTKNFLIKGKSASWGPQAGLICVDQRFSKLEGSDEQKLAKYNAQVQSCIEKKHAHVGPLILGSDRLDVLQNHFAQRDAANPSGESSFRVSDRLPDGSVAIDARGPSGEHYAFVGRPVTQNGRPAYSIEHDGKPLQVLMGAPLDTRVLTDTPQRCHLPPPPNNLPLTADYDLLLIGPSLSELDERDNLPVPDVSHGVFMKRFARYGDDAKANLIRAAEVDLQDPKQFYAAEDPLIGNASKRIQQMIPEINAALVGPHGQWVVHHNADAGSPASEPAANYPATFFLPRKIGSFDEICVIEDDAGLAELVRQAKDEGYHVPVNPLWQRDPVLSKQATARPSFVDALDFMKALHKVV